MVQTMRDSAEFNRYMFAYSKRDVVVFVQFTAGWSDNSGRMMAHYTRFDQRFNARHINRFITLDIDTCDDVAETHGTDYISAYIPSYYAYYKGKRVAMIENASGEDLLRFIREHALVEECAW